MRQLGRWLVTASVLASGLAFAQRTAAPAGELAVAPHTMPPQPKSMPIPKWDPKTVGAVSGKLIGVWRSKSYGVVIGIDTEKEDVILLSVGPAYFIDPKINFAADDQIEATGSRVPYKGRSEMLVSTLKRGDLVIHIRNDKGKKRW